MAEHILLIRPSAGQIVVVHVGPGSKLEFTFDQAGVDVSKDGQDLVLIFNNGGILTLQGFYNHFDAEAEPPTMVVEGKELPGEAFLASLHDPALMPMAGPVTPMGGGGSYEGVQLSGVGGVDRLDKLSFDGWGRATEDTRHYAGVGVKPGGFALGTDPGVEPGIEPGTEPGVEPGIEPGVEPGVDLGVDPGNLPPIAEDDFNRITENDEVKVATGNVLTNDSDPDNDSISVVDPVTNFPIEYGILTLDENGNYTFVLDMENEQVKELFASNKPGDEKLSTEYTYTITDSHGETTTAVLHIDIIPDKILVGTFGSDSLIGGLGDDVLIGDPGGAMLGQTIVEAGKYNVNIMVDCSGSMEEENRMIETRFALVKAIQNLERFEDNTPNEQNIVLSFTSFAQSASTSSLNLDGPQTDCFRLGDVLVGLPQDRSGVAYYSADGAKLGAPTSGTYYLIDSDGNVAKHVPGAAPQDITSTTRLGAIDTDAYNYIQGLTPGGGTNYEAAFLSSEAWFNGVKSNGNENVVFFLTDGEPTYRNIGVNNDTPDRGITGMLTSEAELKEALVVYNRLISGDINATLNAIGVGNSIHSDLLQYFDNTGELVDATVSFTKTNDWTASSGYENSFSYTGKAGNPILFSNASDLEDIFVGLINKHITPPSLAKVGPDFLYGGEGNDIIFGDALNADFMLEPGWIAENAPGWVPGTDLMAGSGLYIVLSYMAYMHPTGYTQDDLRIYLTDNAADFGKSDTVIDAGTGKPRGEDDLLVGGGGNDVLYAQGGNDVVFGGEMHLRINGEELHSHGAASVAELYGKLQQAATAAGCSNAADYLKEHPEVVLGGTQKDGNNILLGGNGNDLLVGGGGNDVLYGGAGDNILFGGGGNNIFAWKLENLGGTDTICDFKLDSDKFGQQPGGRDALHFEGLFDGDQANAWALLLGKSTWNQDSNMLTAGGEGDPARLVLHIGDNEHATLTLSVTDDASHTSSQSIILQGSDFGVLIDQLNNGSLTAESLLNGIIQVDDSVTATFHDRSPFTTMVSSDPADGIAEATGLSFTLDGSEYAAVRDASGIGDEAFGKAFMQLGAADGTYLYEGSSTKYGQSVVGTEDTDVIYASQGNDILVGGGGNDIFVWNKLNMGQDENALDVIKDFTKGDTLRFEDLFLNHAGGAEPALTRMLDGGTWQADGEGGGIFTAICPCGVCGSSIQLNVGELAATLKVSYLNEGQQYTQNVELQNFDASQFHQADALDHAAVAQMLQEIIKIGGSA